ncbi:hypothetical protein BaRGS_00015752, partial [Batillaria attramentaria]
NLGSHVSKARKDSLTKYFDDHPLRRPPLDSPHYQDHISQRLSSLRGPQSSQAALITSTTQRLS